MIRFQPSAGRETGCNSSGGTVGAGKMSERLTKERRDEVRHELRKPWELEKDADPSAVEIIALLDAADRLDELEAANSDTWKERAEKAEARVRETTEDLQSALWCVRHISTRPLSDPERERVAKMAETVDWTEVKRLLESEEPTQ